MRGIQRLSKLRSVGAACNYGPKWPFCWVKALPPRLTFNSSPGLLFSCSHLQVGSCQETIDPLLAEGWADHPTSASSELSLVWGEEGIALHDIQTRESEQSFHPGAWASQRRLPDRRRRGVGSRREGGNLASAWPSCPSHLLSPVFLALREREGGQMR